MTSIKRQASAGPINRHGKSQWEQVSCAYNRHRRTQCFACTIRLSFARFRATFLQTTATLTVSLLTYCVPSLPSPSSFPPPLRSRVNTGENVRLRLSEPFEKQFANLDRARSETK